MELGKVFSNMENILSQEQAGSKPPVIMFPLIIDRDKIEKFNSPLHKPPFEHAQDIKCRKGTAIISPVLGKILDLKQDSVRWKKYEKGMTEDPNKYLNWITIQIYKRGLLGRVVLPTPWIVQMCHIAAGSCDKKIGDLVQKGDLIATTGVNGVITTDINGNPDTHLHIVIGRGKTIKNPFDGFQSYPLHFENVK